ncbi:MAG: hypothetical protein N2167_04775 [Flavobacteriales bacterium]|nr:hypothetical protein [Flavobacteriales bacterium]
MNPDSVTSNKQLLTLRPKINYLLWSIIYKIQLVSGNDAYNHLFEIVTSCMAPEALSKKELNNVRIVHRFLKACNDSISLFSNAYSILESSVEIAWNQPE